MHGLEWSISNALEQEPALRLMVFLGVFSLLALAETLSPRGQRRLSRCQRWPNNVGLILIDTLMVRWLFPFSAVALALWAETQQWGLLNAVPLTPSVAIVGALLMLDFAIYLQHRLFHALPWLWRLHRVHHADLEFDVTTGIRFHPLEILLSMGIKWGVILVLGAPALAVLLFEILLNATSLFNHANLKLSTRWDRWLRWFVVTPDMHRVHHSWQWQETNSNFGFNFPWWDRLLGTYRAQPVDGHEGMTIGLHDFRDPKELRLDRLLVQPFRPLTPPATGKPATRAG